RPCPLQSLRAARPPSTRLSRRWCRRRRCPSRALPKRHPEPQEAGRPARPLPSAATRAPLRAKDRYRPSNASVRSSGTSYPPDLKPGMRLEAREGAPECRPGESQPRVDGSERNVAQLGDVLARHPVELEQGEDRALLDGQLVQDPLDERRRASAFGCCPG